MLEVLELSVQNPQSSFKIIKPRQEATQTNTVTTSEKDTATEGVEDEEAKVEANGLFTCPGDGCIRTFQQSSSLQAYLDAERHKRALEKEKLFDKARRGYAAKIIGERTQVPTVGLCAGTFESKGADLHSSPEKGWALKPTMKQTQFTEEQKKFLTEKFVIGEERGKKADPKELSNEMRKVRNESGSRLFLGSDVLSPQQVAGFFSRLAAKIRKSSSKQHEETDSDDEDHQNAAEKEPLHLKLHAVVEEEIALRHPIVALSRNICNLVHDNKLSTLSVALLREICESLGLNVDDITERKKKPLVNRITRVVGSACVDGIDRCNVMYGHEQYQLRWLLRVLTKALTLYLTVVTK